MKFYPRSVCRRWQNLCIWSSERSYEVNFSLLEKKSFQKRFFNYFRSHERSELPEHIKFWKQGKSWNVENSTSDVVSFTTVCLQTLQLGEQPHKRNEEVLKDGKVENCVCSYKANTTSKTLKNYGLPGSIV